MAEIALNPPHKPAKVPPRTAILIASGDLRESANLACWPAQRAMERELAEALASHGWKVDRRPRVEGSTRETPVQQQRPTEAGGTPVPPHPENAHGFISSQAMGREVFAGIQRETPLIVAEAVWQYSHHVLMGLERHRGPILLVANWSGQWPGLVGVLNLRGSLAKAGVKHSLLWGEDFASPGFREKLGRWLTHGRVRHDTSHVATLDADDLPGRVRKLARSLADDLDARPAILGVFDEGCMGMYNAIIPDHLLHAASAYKERLSQSALFHAMTQVSSDDADEARRWLDNRGMRFITGPDPKSHLTDDQVRWQLKMYIAAVRLADEFGCDAIGIQYQQGLKDLCPASDLAEGLLNCSERPPVRATTGPLAGQIIRDNQPITHFNEVDECAGLDGLITQRVWTALNLQPDNTLHDLRWGDWFDGNLDIPAGATDRDDSRTFVWVFEISGAVPPSHFVRGYADAVSERQPPMYFRLGGGTIKGVSKPGEVVWSRIFVENDRLHMDIGRCRAVSLPEVETHRRWRMTTSQWPIMHAVLYGITRDQMMARHRANHIQVAYAPDAATADAACAIKAAMAVRMGIRVHVCGVNAIGVSLGEALSRIAIKT